MGMRPTPTGGQQSLLPDQPPASLAPAYRRGRLAHPGWLVAALGLLDDEPRLTKGLGSKSLAGVAPDDAAICYYIGGSDRQAAIAIATEIDALGQPRGARSSFEFFRKTSAKLCEAILQPQEPTYATLRQHLVRIDDDRLRRAFAAAINFDQLKEASASKPVKPNDDLWKELSSRGNHVL